MKFKKKIENTTKVLFGYVIKVMYSMEREIKFKRIVGLRIALL